MAQMNNRVKELETTRKDVKKTLLEPYNHFDDQVKTIKGVIDDAVSHVKNKNESLQNKNEKIRKSDC